MKNKRFVNGLQNAALLLLTASALFLLLQTPLLQNRWTSPFASPAAAFTPQPSQEQAGELGAMLGSFHAMITSDSEYGRYGQLCIDDALAQQLIPLFREAMGSAAALEAVTHQDFRDALDSMSIYLDLVSELPLEAIAACLGESPDMDRPVRGMALTAETEEAVSLYLRSEDGGLVRCATALPVSAVQAVCGSVAPNGSAFAYETNYSALAPYTLLAAEVRQFPEVQADLPVGYTDYNLLTALDFNAHTNSRYTDRDGAEVVEESPRTLRICQDGRVIYSCTGALSLSLYRVPAAGDRPALPDALRTAWGLASALTSGTGASPLYLHAVEETDSGYVISFRYQMEGAPVCFVDESDALTVTISGTAVNSFIYRCRSYTPLEEETAAPLLPPAMAAAIASLHPDSGLSVAYVDAGSSRLSPCWLW